METFELNYMKRLLNKNKSIEAQEYNKLVQLWKIYNWSTEELSIKDGSSVYASQIITANQKQWLYKILKYNNHYSMVSCFNWRTTQDFDKDFKIYLEQNKPNRIYNNSLYSFLLFKMNNKSNRV